jgi:adenine-specific DNA glycosylase
MNRLTIDEKLFNEYHALIVHLGKTTCKKIPRCDICPLKGMEHTVKKDGETGGSGERERKKADSRIETRTRTRLRGLKPWK